MSARITFTVLACAVIALGGVRAACAQGIPCRYEVAHVIQAPDGPINSSPTVATAISPNGRYVVGWFRFDAVGQDRAFVYDTQTRLFQALSHPPGIAVSKANDVTDAGVVVGGHFGSAGSFGFIYDAASQTHLHQLSAAVAQGSCTITGINASGTVCGTRALPGTPPDFPLNAFIWSEKDGFTDLGLIDGMSSGAADIADDGQVAIYKGVGLVAYVWDGKRILGIGVFPGADSMTPNAIADGAHVVGGSLFIAGTAFWAVPFEYRVGSLSPLPFLGELESCTALAVNNRQLIVGACRRIGGQANWQPCAWLGGVVRDLGSLIEPGSGVLPDTASAVSDTGHIVCGGHAANNAVVSVVLTPMLGIVGDTNCDRAVNIDDLLAVIQWWGPGASFGDLNGDEMANVADLLIVIDNWTF